MLPAQIVFLAASQAVLGMASDGLWAAATIHPGIAILAAIQVYPIPDAAAPSCSMRLSVHPDVQTVEAGHSQGLAGIEFRQGATQFGGDGVICEAQVLLVAANGFLIARMLLCIAGEGTPTWH
jgi:hypothetical protein